MEATRVTAAPRPAEEDERRALVWLVDQRTHGGPLERRYAATVIAILAWYEQALDDCGNPA